MASTSKFVGTGCYAGAEFPSGEKLRVFTFGFSHEPHQLEGGDVTDEVYKTEEAKGNQRIY
jgi:hypothetical protein